MRIDFGVGRRFKRADVRDRRVVIKVCRPFSIEVFANDGESEKNRPQKKQRDEQSLLCEVHERGNLRCRVRKFGPKKRRAQEFSCARAKISKKFCVRVNL